MERSIAALRTLCAALDRDVFSFYELLFGDPQRYPCIERAGLQRVRRRERPAADVDAPSRGSRFAVHRGRALLSTSLTAPLHEPVAGRSRAPASSARGCSWCATPRGIWRLATIEPLLAAARRHSTATPTPTRSSCGCTATTPGRAARAPRPRARLEARRAAATVDGAAPAPCAVAQKGDPGGDVVVQESRFRARDQAAHAGVDLVGAGVSAAAWPCARPAAARELRGPPARRARARPGRHRRRRARARAGRLRRRRGPKPIAGVAAHLDADGLRARAAARPLEHGRRDARASSSASCPTATTRGSRAPRALRGPSRRCDRRTCSAAPPPRRARRARGP